MSIQIRHPLLREFFDQLRFAPAHQQKKYLSAAQQLLEIVDRRQDYPLEFVIWRITGYRPTWPRYEQAIVSGQQLADDLRVWLIGASRKQAEAAAAQPEPIWTVAQLAQRFSVSQKTIRRWEKQGLAGRIYRFEDGKLRKGYPDSAVNRFQQTHPELIRSAQMFSQVCAAEKQALQQRARQLAQTGQFRSFHSLVRALQQQTGRHRLTLQKILEQMPDCQQLVPPVKSHCSDKQARQIYQQYQQGVSIKELVSRFGKSRAALYRIIADAFLRDIQSRPIEYIDSPEFSEPAKAAEILSEPLASLADAAAGALTAWQEARLFCRYNYLKYLAAQSRRQLPSKPSLRALKAIVALLEQAEQVKQTLLRLYTPLVMRIAGRHARGGMPFGELVSDGMLALMSAVEKFNYLRGHRFSTFAGWVIAKDFARKLPAESARPDRAGRSDVQNVSSEATAAVPSAETVEQAQRDLLTVIENHLEPREQFIIIHHFGLSRSVLRNKPMTLKEIGEKLNLTKERVRQIELVALHKLRRVLSPEQFEWLTR